VKGGESKGLKRAQQIVEAYKRDPDYKFNNKGINNVSFYSISYW
jgi:hypothetical protein